MTFRDLAFMVVGWQIAIAVRLIADFIFSITDERKRRRRRAASEEQA